MYNNSQSEQRIEYFRDQNYQGLKNDCIENGTLFEDPFFRPIDTSIFYSKSLPEGVRWMRPHEIVEMNYRPKEPRFIVGRAEANDLDQGYLGNCWFIAGCIAITYHEKLFHKVVPQGQVMTGRDYAGIFHFRFWIYGSWYDVVVDDYLPVYENGTLIFCHNTEEPNEFWAALLEKAFAKVCGSYENLEGGYTADALISMSGGIEETLFLNKFPSDHVWTILVQSRRKKSMCGAYIEPDPYVPELKLPNGLIKGHAYIITRTATVNTSNGEEYIIRIRNPWGIIEWNGKWSDKSYEWNYVTPAIREKLSSTSRDGEFWMNIKDFCSNFDSIQFCHITPDSISGQVMMEHKNHHITWKMMAYHGEWIPNHSAGGCGNYNNSFWINPQYLVKITDVDKDDDEEKSSIIISLMQKYTREKRTQNGGRISEDFIQFRIYRVKKLEDLQRSMQTGEKLNGRHFERIGNSGDYINKREVVSRFRLQPGYYIIVPSLFEANVSGHFLLRVFTEELIDKYNGPIKDVDRKESEFKTVNSAPLRASRFQADSVNPIQRRAVAGNLFTGLFSESIEDHARIIHNELQNQNTIDLDEMNIEDDNIRKIDVTNNDNSGRITVNKKQCRIM